MSSQFMQLSSSPEYQVSEFLQEEFSPDELNSLREQFFQIDRSQDGHIDVEELGIAMKALNIHMKHERLLELISQVDDNKNGTLEFPEFVMLIRNIRHGISNELALFIQNSEQASIIRLEYEALSQNMPPYIESIHVQESIRHWVVDIIGPPNTSYAGAIFQLDIEFGMEYPYQAPEMTFLTRMFHLNFILMLNGTCPVTRVIEHWDPSWNITLALEKIVHLFSHPDPALIQPIYASAPFERSDKKTTCRSFGQQCVTMYSQDRAQYENIAKIFTKEHCRTTTKHHPSRKD